MSDDEDFTLDFTGVKAATGPQPVPSGWYKVEVTNYEDQEMQNDGKKLKAGTKGTSWEFTIAEGEYENRKFWTNHWHAASSLPFMKALFRASGAFTDDELEGSLSLDDRGSVEGQELWVKVKLVPETPQWSAKNDVKDYKKLDEYQPPSTDNDDSLMPS